MTDRKFTSVGKAVARVDSVKLATGRPCFVDDLQMTGMLHAKILHSPHAHARLRDIDAAAARRLPGVHAVLTYRDVARVPYTTAGQGWPEPSPYDTVMLDNKVRFVGDRVAVVAAETLEIAARALELIAVDYERLPAVLDPEESMKEGAPVIHDEPDCTGAHDARRNVAAHVAAAVGDVEAGFRESDLVLEREYRVHYVQQSSIEPHVAITWLDEDHRLVVRTSTQVPFHVRRIIAPLLGIPVKRIRVIKPRIGGGFGGKQEILIEDLCGALTLATGRPVRLEYTREEELTAARTRHPQIVRFKSGVRRDGTLLALRMDILENTGAYGTHALTVQCVSGSRALSLYRARHIKFEAHAVYTNLAVAGAFRGYGCPQAFFALESHMDEVAEALGMDPAALRQKNHVREGDDTPISKVLGEGGEGYAQVIQSCGLSECIEQGMEAIGWRRRYDPPGQGPVRRGIGMACLMQASGIPGVDMGAASIKMNEDGSFNLLVGATDIGTGADTMFAQIAAEALAVPYEQMIVYSSDTDMTPFDPGAYASSTTYISGTAVKKAAEEVRRQIVGVAATLLGADAAALRCADSRVHAPDGRSVGYADVCLSALYRQNQFQIMAVASHMSYDSPPPFAAQFAEVEVDTETGVVRVLRLVSCVDCGVAVNPSMAEGQVEGAVTQALGYATTERMPFDAEGRPQHRSFRDYSIYTAADMPELKTIMVQTYEPTGPFGAKAIAEIPINGPAPAIANAVFNATGARLRELPLTPEKVLAAIRQAAGAPAAAPGELVKA